MGEMILLPSNKRNYFGGSNDVKKTKAMYKLAYSKLKVINRVIAEALLAVNKQIERIPK